MPETTQLIRLLQEHLALYITFRKQRLELLAAMLIALVEVATVNLAKVALALNAKPSANYRRIQRFFAESKLPQRATAAFVLHLLPIKDRFVISIDRTHWQFGKTPINLFMASVVYQGTAFPLCWIMLGKPGSTHQAEHRALAQTLLADRTSTH